MLCHQWIFVSAIFLFSVVDAFVGISKNAHCVPFSKKAAAASSVEVQEPAIFNFGAASSRDNVLFTAERPGNPATKTGKADMDQVHEWIQFMKQQQGIDNVIALLDENEFESYGEPGLLQIYEEAGIKCLVQPMRGQNACKNIIDFVRQAEAADEKVVAHCTGGIGRAGRVAACWLMKR